MRIGSRLLTVWLFGAIAASGAQSQQTVGLFLNESPEPGLVLFGPMGGTVTVERQANGNTLICEGASGHLCGIGVGGGYTWSPVPSGSLFFLVVGTDETPIYESSWGRASDGDERNGTKASFLCGTTTKVVTSSCP